MVYRTFHQDKADNDTYPPLRMPVLAIGGQYLDARYVTVEDSGHFVAEEQPGALAAELEKLFG
ncbi:alpha/beta fold hydrolase [Streptomyces niveiscabiei]|uniref:Alpha/beta fold hydrolase n=1 Tax=Streptomyces niveiscabiei TaxID=164115 RepID=A0ABW9I1P2_9ACTN